MSEVIIGERIAVLESEVRNVAGDVNSLSVSMNNALTGFRQEVREEMKEMRAAVKRPSWGVTAVMTLETSLIVGLAVALLSH